MAMIRATKGSVRLTAPAPQKYGFYGFWVKKLDSNSKIDAKNALKTRTKPTESAIYP
jgi:hypothetical protein